MFYCVTKTLSCILSDVYVVHTVCFTVSLNEPTNAQDYWQIYYVFATSTYVSAYELSSSGCIYQRVTSAPCSSYK
jgi:hypothetical protein